MAVSKVILNGNTLIDTTQKTVTASKMLSGETALNNAGEDITGNIATKTSSNMTVSGATVTAQAGYYASNASKSVATGTAGTPTATKGTVSNHSVTVTPSVTNTTGYISGGTKTGTAVTVSARELVSGTTLYCDESGSWNVANAETFVVDAGTVNNPTATKGTVSNHAVTVTPSVSHVAGWISSGTKTGTPVTVSASELVSGTKTIDENGTGIDVTNYSSVDVNVSGEGSGITYGTFTMSFTTTQISAVLMEEYSTYATTYYPGIVKCGNQSNLNIALTARWIVSDDGFMYVTFFGPNDSYWPSVTATSGTATVKASHGANTGWPSNTKKAPNGANVVYKISVGATVTVSSVNNS